MSKENLQKKTVKVYDEQSTCLHLNFRFWTKSGRHFY